MDINLVLDTNIVVEGCKPKISSAHKLLVRFTENTNLKLIFDVVNDANKSIVYKQYIKRLSNSDFFWSWYSALSSNRQIRHIDGKLDDKVKDTLNRKGYIHQHSDRVFLAVSLNTDKKLVSEDSDFVHTDKKTQRDNAVKGFLKTRYDVDVMNAQECLNFINDK